ncbi:dolichyl-diphosphooligosaccharide--protein glycosyltransferase subunit Ost4p [Diutina catenulata]
MITDAQLNTIALGFGFASIVLILVYHTISTNVKNLEEQKLE